MWHGKKANPLNTLYGRLALMMIGLIVLLQISAEIVVNRDRGRIDTEHVRNEIILAVHAKEVNAEYAAYVGETLGIRYVPNGEVLARGCPAPCSGPVTRLDRTLQDNLPEGSRSVSDPSTGAVWVRYGEAPYWIYMPNALLSSYRFHGEQVLMLVLAIGIALFGAWHLQQPLSRLADAARRFRLGRDVEPLQVDGPVEMQSLTTDFNRMMHELSCAEQDREVMLAGIAHDLKAPISRILVRADMLRDAAQREGFSRDGEVLLRIVEQFLTYARQSVNASPYACVEEQCRVHREEAAQSGLEVRLDLRAGEDFRLPFVDIDRILSNLIGNAVSYGRPPVEIATCQRDGMYVLTVRDHGEGVPHDRLESALLPYVRIDDGLEGGSGHCGLGLAIVRKLVGANHGHIVCANADDGGFVVTLTFPPAETETATGMPVA